MAGWMEGGQETVSGCENAVESGQLYERRLRD
jgi:hypothetical protein